MNHLLFITFIYLKLAFDETPRIEVLKVNHMLDKPFKGWFYIYIHLSSIS